MGETLWWALKCQNWIWYYLWCMIAWMTPFTRALTHVALVEILEEMKFVFFINSPSFLGISKSNSWRPLFFFLFFFPYVNVHAPPLTHLVQVPSICATTMNWFSVVSVEGRWLTTWVQIFSTFATTLIAHCGHPIHDLNRSIFSYLY